MRTKITFYQRKNLQKNGSVEIIFNNLRNDIKDKFIFKIKDITSDYLDCLSSIYVSKESYNPKNYSFVNYGVPYI